MSIVVFRIALKVAVGEVCIEQRHLPHGNSTLGSDVSFARALWHTRLLQPQGESWWRYVSIAHVATAGDAGLDDAGEGGKHISSSIRNADASPMNFVAPLCGYCSLCCWLARLHQTISRTSFTQAQTAQILLNLGKDACQFMDCSPKS